MGEHKRMGVCMLFVAFMLIGIASYPAAAAQEGEPAAESEYSDFNLPKEDQKLVFDAIEASTIPDKEKKDLIKNLKDIWSGKSALSEEEQNQVLAEAASILYDYIGIDQGSVGILWNSEPHSDLARTAGVKMGVPQAYWQTLYAEANTPDTWFRYIGDHFWYVSYNFGDGPSKARKYANDARYYLRIGYPSEGYKRLSWSIHYMSDLANPWHTVLLYGQAYHTTYENYVSNNWNSGHNFNRTIQEYSGGPKNIIYPEVSAKELAKYSNKYINYLVRKISLDPYCSQDNPNCWKNDPTVISYTKDVLNQSIQYDMGLVNYATR